MGYGRSAEAGRATDVGPAMRPEDDLLHKAVGAIARVHLFTDLHERAAETGLPLPLGRKRRARLDEVRRSGALFIHVPKNAGTSLNMLLYGQTMRHETARYYRHAAPDLFSDPSITRFAIWRDPVERFLSSYDFARAGGGRMVRLHPHFAALYRRFTCLDDAIDHVEQASGPYAMDHVFRPQSWYVTHRDGSLAVDLLFPFSDLTLIPRHVPALAGSAIPHLNETKRTAQHITPAQADRIRRLYARDEALRDRLVRAES